LVDPTKIVIILELASPTSVRQLRETLGHKGYWLCADYNTHGKSVEERGQVPIE
jgi:hypothetical protein